MPLLFTLLIPLFLVGTALAFSAFSSLRRVDAVLRNFPLNELTRRVFQLEQKLAELQKNLASTCSPQSRDLRATPEDHSPSQPHAPVAASPEPVSARVTPTPVPPVPTPAPIPHSTPPTIPQAVRTLPPIPKEPSAADLESLIGGRWFNRIGIVALLFAVSYFLKLAFDNNWIGPGGRVAIGIVLGLLMLPWSEWLLSRDYTYFSEGIAGLGEATLFVSVWAGCQYYPLFSRQTGFVALVLVTAIMAYLALRRNSERIAFLSLLGGLLTPALMSSGKNEQVVLFSYLLLLGATALFVSWRKNWQTLLLLAFVGTQLYFWQWYDLFYNRAHVLGSTLAFGTLIFALFAVIPAARALLGLGLRPLDILMVLANAGAYIGILYTLLWPNERWPLTLFFLALAIAHQAIALLLPDPHADEAIAARYLYTGVAAACLTLAIPTKLEHNWIALAFAAEGAALVWIGFRTLGNLLRPFGYFLLFLSAVHLVLQPPSAGTFLFNERFVTYLALIAALVVCLFPALEMRKNAPKPHTLAGPALPPQNLTTTPASDSIDVEAAVLTIAMNFFALLALSQEFWDFFGGGPHNAGNSLAQHLSISVLWTGYAAVLLLVGARSQSALLRWQALILLAVVVAKVFFYDLSFLDRAYRILSFLILGSALLAISFFYQRKLARDRSG